MRLAIWAALYSLAADSSQNGAPNLQILGVRSLTWCDKRYIEFAAVAMCRNGRNDWVGQAMHKLYEQYLEAFDKARKFC